MFYSTFNTSQTHLHSSRQWMPVPMQQKHPRIIMCWHKKKFSIKHGSTLGNSLKDRKKGSEWNAAIEVHRGLWRINGKVKNAIFLCTKINRCEYFFGYSKNFQIFFINLSEKIKMSLIFLKLRLHKTANCSFPCKKKNAQKRKLNDKHGCVCWCFNDVQSSLNDALLEGWWKCGCV